MNTCSALVLRSYPPEAHCFLPGGGRDGRTVLTAGRTRQTTKKKRLKKKDKRKGEKGPGFHLPSALQLQLDTAQLPKSKSNAMSSSRQHSESRAIPTRTVLIDDSTQLPHDYCTTPGGTLFSTTPGGTRIIYDRKFLLDRRNSPIAQTPPAHLPVIPGVTSQNILNEKKKKKNEANNINNHDGKPGTGEDPQFEMDI
ncbi:eukaryotic translation initiation factor 4E-binding protein 2 [Silurus asotus]|uniref:Eukaryotic translation initiation factor 4E-binding protein 2 n=1 Tax=Silurus asotus TaxID=30991 RepID=A0AAD5F8H4_SILAS|nr:eukaryotic translation initiation factor 4E-binding protein 2 [Silurus asotus]